MDCCNLKWQLSALDQGKKYRVVNIAVMAIAAFQAFCTSICILLADFLPQGGAGVNFALVFLMSAALNAGLVWPRQILVTSQALEASDKLKSESKEQARKLSFVARHAKDSIIISDTYGRISWVNEAFSKITGYTRSEAIGRTPPDLLNDEATDLEVSKKIVQHIQAGDPIRAKVLNKRKDGEKSGLKLILCRSNWITDQLK